MAQQTLAEQILLQQQNLFILDKFHRQENFAVLAGDIPGVFHINQSSDLQILQLSKNSRELTGLEAEQVVDMGLEYFSRHMHPYTLTHVFPIFHRYYASGDSRSVCTEWQTMFLRQSWQDLLTVTKISQDKTHLISISLPPAQLHLSRGIARALDDQVFIRQHYQKFMSLTVREKEILRLIAEGLTNEQIGAQLFISSHTVRTHRNRIFSKLEIKTFREVIRYADNFL